MADYSSLFTEMAGKINTATTRTTGEREPTLVSGATWDIAAPEVCKGCTAHSTASPPGTHPVVGRHFCTYPSAITPILASQRFPMSLCRKLEWFLHLQNRVANGWMAADPSLQLNGSAANNFATWYTWNLIGVSGNVLTFDTGSGALDPRNVRTSFSNVRSDTDDASSAFTYSDEWGAWCQVGDQVTIGGNSVVAGRICADIIAYDLSNVSGGSATITINQDAGLALTKINPYSSDKPTITVWREAYHPEKWPVMWEPSPLYSVENVLEVQDANFPTNGVFDLLDAQGHATAIAVPTGDYEPLPGNTAPTSLYGTFQVLVRVNGLDLDYTPSLRILDAANKVYRWPRVVATRVDGAWSTKFYAGALDSSGNAQTNLLDKATKITIRYRYRVADASVTDAVCTCQDHCLWDCEDFNKLVGTSSGLGSGQGVGVDASGRHHYCQYRSVVPTANISAYVPGGCYQMGSCPYFIPGEQGHVTPEFWGYIFSGQNTFIKQLVAGISGTGNFLIERGTVPSLMWLAGHPDMYASPGGFFPGIQPQCGPFIYYWTETNILNGELLLNYAAGSIYNYNMVPALVSTMVYPNYPAATMGVFPRQISSEFVPNDQFSSGPYDIYNLLSWWRLGRRTAVSFKDISIYGDSLSKSVRPSGDIEGENKIQRFNKTTELFIANISTTITDTPQPSTVSHYVNFLKTPQVLVGGKTSSVTLQIVADGAADHGQKYVGDTGGNAQIHRVESLGNGVYRLHCMIGGCYTVSNIVSNDDGSLGGMDQLTTFWGSGNVAALQYPYAMNSHYNDNSLKGVGGACQRAQEGDTIHMLSSALLGNAHFWVKAVHPSSGDSVSGMTSDTGVLSGVPGTYFRGISGASGFNITHCYTNIFTSVSTDWMEMPLMPLSRDNNGDRPTGEDAGDVKMLVLSVPDAGTGTITEEGLLSYAAYYYAAIAEWPINVKIDYTVDGQPPHTATLPLKPPTIVTESGDTSRINQWGVFHMLDNGSTELYTYAGMTTTDFDFDVPLGSWRYNTSTSSVVFNPNESGRKFTVLFKTTAAQDISTFPAGTGYPEVYNDNSDRATRLSYLKQMDTVDIYDEGWCNNGSTQNIIGNVDIQQLVGDQFEVHTSGVIQPGCTVRVFYAAKGTQEWTEIPSNNLVVFYALGQICILNPMPLPTNVCFHVLATIANRTQETPVELLQSAVAHCSTLDSVILNNWIGSTSSYAMGAYISQGPTEWTQIPDLFPAAYAPSGWVHGLPHAPYTVHGIDNANTDTTMLLLETAKSDPMMYPVANYTFVNNEGYYFDGYGGTSAMQLGCNSLPPENSPSYGVAPGVISKCALFDVKFTNILSRLPTGTTILDAQIELKLNGGGITTIVANKVYGLIGYSLGSAFYSVVQDQGTPSPPPITAGTMPCAIGFLGQLADGSWVTLPLYLEGSSSISVDKWSVVGATQAITSLLQYRSREYTRVVLVIGPNASASAGVPTVTGNKNKTFVSTIMNAYESISGVSNGGKRDGTFQWPSDTASDANWTNLLYNPHVKFTSTSTTVLADSLSIGNLAIKYRLPDSTLTQSITYGNMPPLNVRQY